MRYLPSAIAIAGAVALLFAGYEHGWGWLIFVGLLLYQIDRDDK